MEKGFEVLIDGLVLRTMDWTFWRKELLVD